MAVDRLLLEEIIVIFVVGGHIMLFFCRLHRFFSFFIVMGNNLC